MQIGNPIDCDANQGSQYKQKLPLVVDHAFQLMEFVHLLANVTFGGISGILSNARPELLYPCILPGQVKGRTF